MRKKQTLALMEKIVKVNDRLIILNSTLEKVNNDLVNLNNNLLNQLNINLEKINNLNLNKFFPEILQASISLQDSILNNNNLKNQTNEKVNMLIEEVQYANKRLAN